MRIPRLMKNLIMKLDRGQLETSEDLTSFENECVDDEPYEKEDGGQETMDTLNVNFMMYRRRNGPRTPAMR
jgi:hypothetical protein